MEYKKLVQVLNDLKDSGYEVIWYGNGELKDMGNGIKVPLLNVKGTLQECIENFSNAGEGPLVITETDEFGIVDITPVQKTKTGNYKMLKKAFRAYPKEPKM